VGINNKDKADDFLADSESITGTQDWTPLSLVFTIPEQQVGNTLSVSLRRINDPAVTTGNGSVWFDSYEFYKLPVAAK
jgi:hypothetical protein